MTQTNIMIVEDEGLVVLPLRKKLENLGYKVVASVATGEDVLPWVVATHPDLILMDICLAGTMDGIDAAAQLQRQLDIPVVYLTAHTDSDTLERARATEPFGYVVKPFNTKELCTTIEMALYRHRLAKQLRESEEKYRLLVENQTDLVIKMDTAGRFLFVSPSYCQTFGKTEAELLNTTFMPLVPEEDRQQVVAAMTSLYQPPYTSYVEQRALTTQGWRWFGWSQKAVLDEQQQVVAITGVGRDITERKLAEQALWEQKERAQVTLRSIGDAVITTDATGQVDYLNPVAEILTGWKMAEACGQPLTSVFPIINEESRQPVSDWVERRLKENGIVGLAGHACLISRTGREYAIQGSMAPICDARGRVFGRVVIFSDVTESRRLSQAMSHQATHDSLTGLINRQEFERRLQRVLKTSHEQASEHVLGYLDLDRFKIVNDTCGHIAGDKLLRQISELLKSHLRKRDTIARLGGDEFGILLEHCLMEQALGVAESLRQAVESVRFSWGDKLFSIGVSIGLVSINQFSESPATVLGAADAACYSAKEQGRNRIHTYQANDAILARQQGEMQWIARIPQALKAGRFQLCWQRIMPLQGCQAQGEHYELLLRLQDETGQIILPGAFLPAAERYKLASQLDRWVLSTTLDWLAQHPERCEQLAFCGINLSGQSLGEADFLAFVLDQLTNHTIPLEKLCFEIAETVAISDLVNVNGFINTLKAHGCRFALDNFGSGLSSFSYLNNLAVDFLKIDGSLVKDLVENPISVAIVKAINDIARVMGKQTIAESVEHQLTLNKLGELGVNYAQGYFISRPQPL